MDVEVEALIKNCEDLLGLSRVLKEGWVFGGLDTLKKEDDKGREREKEEWKEAREGMDKWLRSSFDRTAGQTGDEHQQADDRVTEQGQP